MSVNVTNHCGVVLRLASLDEKRVKWSDVLTAFEVDGPLDRDELIASFGPHFGQQALDTIMARLNALGLVYVDDYFDIVMDLPEWFSPRADGCRAP